MGLALAVWVGTHAGAAPAGRTPTQRSAAEPPAAGSASSTQECRIETAAGPVRALRPAGYAHAQAGTLLYVHGYGTRLDRTWQEHDLPGQFAAAARNALHVLPAAPAAAEESVAFPDLAALLRLVARECGFPAPAGPLLAVGHSAAYRTLQGWLTHGSLREVVLLDALYGNATRERFRAWTLGGRPRRPRRLVLLAEETAPAALRLARSVPGARLLESWPAEGAGLPPAERAARLLYLPSPCGHDEIVSERRVLPWLLAASSLPALAAAANAAGAR